MGVKVIKASSRYSLRPTRSDPRRLVQSYTAPLKAPKRSPDKILLSVLVPTVPDRDSKLVTLLRSLDAQANQRTDVEIIVLRDNRSMVIGEKRTKMLHLAHGEFVSFVDDDDAVTNDYIKSIVDNLQTEDPDVLCFFVMVHGHGTPRICRYHPSLEHANLPSEYRRKPNHLMVWRRELALREPFPVVSNGEDTDWANSMIKHVSSVGIIDRVLYNYQFDINDNSLTPR